MELGDLDGNLDETFTNTIVKAWLSLGIVSASDYIETAVDPIENCANLAFSDVNVSHVYSVTYHLKQAASRNKRNMLQISGVFFCCAATS